MKKLHYGIKIGMIESGIGWVPFVLEMMEHQCDEFRTMENNGLKLRPKEYFKRNFWVSWWFETYAPQHMLEEIGYTYTRTVNPTREFLERRVNALEGGAGALALAGLIMLRVPAPARRSAAVGGAEAPKSPSFVKTIVRRPHSCATSACTISSLRSVPCAMRRASRKARQSACRPNCRNRNGR